MGEKRFKKKQKGKFHPGNYENTSVAIKDTRGLLEKFLKNDSRK